MESVFVLSSFLSLILFSRAASGTTFTFVNNCEYTVWPGILANAGSPKLDSTGFELPKDSTRSFVAPAGWSGRFWGRTGCTFSGSGQGSCKTADCGSGQAECNGAGVVPPATLAEITLGTAGLDFYDVSLVDGFNLPMIVEATGGSGMCASTGCVTDLNRACPAELRFDGGGACRSACGAFGSPEYCCSGAFSSPATCRPTAYSRMFKHGCPRAYSYAYDDPTSTFTCSGADYTVTFCPSMPSQKSTTTPPPTMTTGGTINGGGSPSESHPSMGGSESGFGFGATEVNPNSETGSGPPAMIADRSWMAGMAMGGSTRVYCSSSLRYAAVSIAFTNFIIFSTFS